MRDGRTELDLAELSRQREYLCAVARGLLKDEQRAEDVVQDAFVLALTRPPRDPRAIVPWLARVVRNLARNVVRSEGRRSERETSRSREAAPLSEQDTARELEEQHDVLAAVLGLREPYRTVVHLRYYRKLSTRRIAEHLGLPHKTVTSRLTRAHALLRERLDACGGAEGAWMAVALPLAERSLAPAGILGELVSIGGWMMVKKKLVLAGVGLGLLAAGGARVWLTADPDVKGAGSAVPGPLTLEEDTEAVSTSPEKPPVDEVTRSPAAVPVFGALPAAEAARPLFARLVDAETGDPVPWYFVEVVNGDGESERLASDEHGVLLTERTWASGRLTVHTLDSDVHPYAWIYEELDFAHDHRAEEEPDGPLELPVVVGPTYVLDVTWPAGAGPRDFTAELEPAWHSPVVNSGKAPVRATDGRAWVRFPPNVYEQSGQGMWRLNLEGTGGIWSGSSEVPLVRGTHPEPVRIELVRGGLVRGTARALASDGVVAESPDLTRVRVRLDAPDGTTTAIEPLDVEGRFELRYVVPGPYTLRVSSDRHDPFAEELEVRGGEVTRIDPVLRGLAGLGSIRGTLRTRAGNADLTKVELTLQRVDGTGIYLARPTVREGEEGAVGEFHFEDLPEGDYRLSPWSHTGSYEWTPGDLSVRTGADGLEFTCEDSEPLRALVLKAYAADTGEPSRFFYVNLHTRSAGGGTGSLSSSAGGTGEVRFDVRASTEYGWMLTAEGFVPAWMDGWSFPGEGDEHTESIRLERGWGSEVRLFDSASGAPAADVEVLLDGVSAGKTDAEGILRVRWPSRPSRLEIESELWQVRPVGMIAADGTFSEAPFGIMIALESTSR